MKQKSYHDLYLISRKFPGETFYAQELLQIFGYSKNTNPEYSKISYFAEKYAYKHPSWLWKIRDVVAIKPSLINIVRDVPHITGPNKEVLRLIPRNEAPFYLLKEYGGPII